MRTITLWPCFARGGAALLARGTHATSGPGAVVSIKLVQNRGLHPQRFESQCCAQTPQIVQIL